jgi:signal-transduction protein with cAMP-binding, CBS, and nucleotidyltransferase domain
MPLSFSIIERFTSEYAEAMRDKTLLRHDRYHMLSALKERLYQAMRDYETFEAELSSMIKSIEEAKTYEELGGCHQRSVAGVRNYFLEEQTLIDVHDLFGHIRDAITARVLCLVEREMEQDGLGPPPVEYAWVGLGSEGRNEQTFVTDQDNMIIYDETNDAVISEALARSLQNYRMTTNKEEPRNKAGVSELVASYYGELARRVVERLHVVGFSKCKGGIMPSNEKWRGSTRDWEKKVRETLTEDKKTLELLDLIILSDARHIYGAKRIFDVFLQRFHAMLQENRAVMKELTQSAVFMPTALGFFGRFKVEAEGEHKGKLNIKLHGWAPLIMSVRALALAEGLGDTNTLKRIRKLREMNLIKRELEEELVDAYLLFVRLRVMNQINEPDSNNANHVDPNALDPEAAGNLRKGMRVVESFQKYINEMLLFGQPF